MPVPVRPRQPCGFPGAGGGIGGYTNVAATTLPSVVDGNELDGPPHADRQSTNQAAPVTKIALVDLRCLDNLSHLLAPGTGSHLQGGHDQRSSDDRYG